MLYFMVGLPGWFGRWCAHATAAMVRKTRPCEVVMADTAAQLTRQLLRTGGGETVVLASHPGGRLHAALVQSNRNFVVTVDDPRYVLAELVLEGREFRDALRLVASACAVIPRYAASPRALVLGAGRHEAVAAAGMMASHFACPCDGDSLGAIVAGLPGPAGEDNRARAWWTMLDPARRTIAQDALGAYLGAADKPQPLTWGREMFLANDCPLSGPVDITGRARVLFEGPEVTLPEGAWRLSLETEISRAAMEQEFELEVFAGRRLASRTVRPERSGPMRAHLDVVVDDSVDYPLSLRLSTRRAAFDGTVTLVRAMAHPR